ncbi:VanZ family protein [Dyadobacter bucti]|uniref:VanZ family protein n=1 Tax=Dyadobacter bucti TaxID=2572203 RepID=UPI003F72E693
MAFKIGLLAIGAAGVLYLSWLPDPDIGLQPYFPHWLGKWINANGNLRTAVPFIFLGAAMEVWFYKNERSSRRRRLIVLISVAVVIVAETGQLFLPKRHFDLLDIGWGFIGSVVGICAGAVVNSLLKWKFSL